MPFRLMLFVCVVAVEPFTTYLTRIDQSVTDILYPVLRIGAAFGHRVVLGHVEK